MHCGPGEQRCAGSGADQYFLTSSSVATNPSGTTRCGACRYGGILRLRHAGAHQALPLCTALRAGQLLDEGADAPASQQAQIAQRVAHHHARRVGPHAGHRAVSCPGNHSSMCVRPASLGLTAWSAFGQVLHAARAIAVGVTCFALPVLAEGGRGEAAAREILQAQLVGTRRRDMHHAQPDQTPSGSGCLSRRLIARPWPGGRSRSRNGSRSTAWGQPLVGRWIQPRGSLPCQRYQTVARPSSPRGGVSLPTSLRRLRVRGFTASADSCALVAACCARASRATTQATSHPAASGRIRAAMKSCLPQASHVAHRSARRQSLIVPERACCYLGLAPVFASLAIGGGL